jgi:hypothetical protein
MGSGIEVMFARGTNEPGNSSKGPVLLGGGNVTKAMPSLQVTVLQVSTTGTLRRATVTALDLNSCVT